MNDHVPIRKLPSGVVGFDEVLGGGIPELSFNMIVGGPGCGKTTLGHQIAFANASPKSKALYVTIIGEPPLKMLRYQQQYTFFDTSKVGSAVEFVHLGDVARNGGLEAVLERITAEVERKSPSIVVVDSFRSIARRQHDVAPRQAELDMQDFIQRLALELASAEATTFLIGEYRDDERESPVFTVADGILQLEQAVDRNSVVRKVRVVKMRGQAQIPGLHTARITSAGLSVFPRITPSVEIAPSNNEERLSTGVDRLDVMLGGGIPRGYSTLLTGPSGSGKTILGNAFIREGGRKGEAGIIAVFERRPKDYLLTTPCGRELQQLVDAGKLEILYLRPLDLSIDETLLAIRDAVQRTGAKRALLDSLSGLELALAPTFREDFRESLYRMVNALTGFGVTVVSTVELHDAYSELSFSPFGTLGFLTDVIVMQRYVELGGAIRRVLGVMKVRGHDHSKELREYEIKNDGDLTIGEPIVGFEGLLTGHARKG